MEMHTVNEVAKRLKFSTKTIYRKVRKGEIPAKKLGQSIRISEKSLQNYLNGSDV